ncbi:hypothetical protein [Paenibacillus sp. FSL K6-2859]|uniref:hypothetical protein n=1 Tax=Paenibacillus sp. FSL K6-2859 TaxID=2921482 RepID=UPI0030F6813B
MRYRIYSNFQVTPEIKVRIWSGDFECDDYKAAAAIASDPLVNAGMMEDHIVLLINGESIRITSKSDTKTVRYSFNIFTGDNSHHPLGLKDWKQVSWNIEEVYSKLSATLGITEGMVIPLTFDSYKVEKTKHDPLLVHRITQWNLSLFEAEALLELVQDRKGILITGDIGSGKTKMLNELLRLQDLNIRFRYISRLPLQNYDLEPDNLERRVFSNNADFVVLDEADEDEMMSVIGNLNRKDFIVTYITPASSPKRRMFAHNQIGPKVEASIEMTGYNNIWNLEIHTIHDRLLFNAELVLNEITEENQQYSFVNYIRPIWLERILPSEKAAVQLAYLNRQVENGGLSGWYQNGYIADDDIDDLIQLAKLGMEYDIPGFVFFERWLEKVKEEYLPSAHRLVEENDEYDSTPLEELYWEWADRNECFDKLLHKMEG